MRKTTEEGKESLGRLIKQAGKALKDRSYRKQFALADDDEEDKDLYRERRKVIRRVRLD